MVRDSLTPFQLALSGCLVICFGSLVAASAPGDGQTGMVVFPIWGIGAVTGIAAFGLLLRKGADRRQLTWVVLCAAVAIGSVVYAFQAGERYVREVEEYRQKVRDKPVLVD